MRWYESTFLYNDGFNEVVMSFVNKMIWSTFLYNDRFIEVVLIKFMNTYGLILKRYAKNLNFKIVCISRQTIMANETIFRN